MKRGSQQQLWQWIMAVSMTGWCRQDLGRHEGGARRPRAERQEGTEAATDT